MSWEFVTNHARVLLAVAAGPTGTVRQIAAEVGITERAAHRVISNLVDAGYLERNRAGRRVEYQLNLEKLHHERVDRARVVRDLVGLLTSTAPPDALALEPTTTARP